VRCEDPTATGGEPTFVMTQWRRPDQTAPQNLRDAWADKVSAACFVMRSLDEAMGLERMLETIAALRDGVDPWDPDRPVDGRPTPLNDARWLDTVTELGLVPAGADPHLAANLLVTLGVAADPAGMAVHEATRDAYHAHVAATGTAPAFIVEALRLEDTAAARAALDTASAALATAASVDGILPGVTADVGPVAAAVDDATCQEDLDAASALAESAARARDRGRRRLRRRDGSPRRDTGTRKLGTTLPEHAALVAAVTAVDEAGATGRAQAIRTAIDGSRDAGLLRVVIAVAVVVGLVLLLAVTAFVVRRRRRRAVTSAGPAVEPAPGPTDPASPPPAEPGSR
jgi:hypothetical protein